MGTFDEATANFRRAIEINYLLVEAIGDPGHSNKVSCHIAYSRIAYAWRRKPTSSREASAASTANRTGTADA